MKKLIGASIGVLCAAGGLWAGGLPPFAGVEGLRGSTRVIAVSPGAERALPNDPGDAGNSNEPAAHASSASAGEAAALSIVPIAPRVCLSFQTIEQGQYSGFGDYCNFSSVEGAASQAIPIPAAPCFAKVAQPSFEGVIRDECQWIDFWTEHTGNQFPPPPPPAVDFDQFAVIAVVSGTRSNGCYGMSIKSLTQEKCGVVVRVREQVPCAGQLCTLALTNNYHFVKVCKNLIPFETPLCFEHRFEDAPCTIGILCATPVPDLGN